MFLLDPTKDLLQCRVWYNDVDNATNDEFTSIEDSFYKGLSTEPIFRYSGKNVFDHRKLSSSFVEVNGIYLLPQGLFTLGLLEHKGETFPGAEILAQSDIERIAYEYINSVIICSKESTQMYKQDFVFVFN